VFTSTASSVAPNPARNDGAPTARTESTVGRWGSSCRSPTRYGRRRWTKKNQADIAAETAWPPTVPRPAPTTPRSSPKMSSGSRVIWTITGTTHSIVENSNRPSARTRAENPVEKIAPPMITAAYGRA
jgi:hypothetical protein